MRVGFGVKTDRERERAMNGGGDQWVRCPLLSNCQMNVKDVEIFRPEVKKKKWLTWDPDDYRTDELKGLKPAPRIGNETIGPVK